MTFCVNNLLPSEILSLIFLTLYEPESTPFPPEDAHELHQHPLMDHMLVCRSWYRVISTTPSLWTTVWIGRRAADSGENVYTDLWLQKVQERLKRSGNLPLNILVALDHLINFDVVVDVLIRDAHRWASIHLVHEDPVSRLRFAAQAVEDVKRLFSLPMPMLRSLNVARFRSPDGTLNSYTIEVNNPLPSLERLSCTGHLVLPASAPVLAIVTLTDADMDRLQPPPDPRPPPFASLVEFNIINSSRVLDIFSLLPAPSIRTLVMDSSDDVHDDQPQETLPAFPVFHGLEELQWTDKGGDHRALKHILRKCPNLRRFSNYVHGLEESIDFDMSATTIPPFLTPSRDPESSSSEEFCPDLEEVCFDIVDCAQVDKFLSARPHIKLVRILQDPLADPGVADNSGVQQVLDRMRTKADVIIGRNPKS